MGEREFRAVWMERSRETMLREVVAEKLVFEVEEKGEDVLEVSSIHTEIVHTMCLVDLRGIVGFFLGVLFFE